MQRHIVRWLFIASALLLLASSTSLVFAQTDVEKNSATRGTLTNDQLQVQYNVVANAGDNLTIEVLSITQGMFVQAFILAPDGEVVEALINAEETLAVRTQQTLTETGSYTILVSSRNDTPGDFILTLVATTGEPVRTVDNTPCDDYIEQVLARVDDVCDGLSRNQICYANDSITIQPEVAQFASVGDVANVSDLFSLELSPLNANANQWGVAVMTVQANLPDTLPDQNVQIAAFGNVSLTPAQGNNFGRMQSFYVSADGGQSMCGGVAQQGILIDTPSDAGIVELSVNDIRLQIASTLFISIDSVDPNTQELSISTLEGVVVVEAQSAIQLAPEGNRVRVPIDATGRANGAPRPAEPLDDTRLPAPVQRLIAAPNAETEPDPTNTATADVTQTASPTPMPPAATATPTATVTPTPSPTESEGLVLPVTGPCVLTTADAEVTVNVRSGPGLDYDAIGAVVPTRTYTVIGRNADATWYQISTGWVSRFVTRRGGDQCQIVPVTFIEPTVEPTTEGDDIAESDEPVETTEPTEAPVATDAPPPTEPAVRVAVDNEYSVTIDYNTIGQQHFLLGAISHPDGDRQDTIEFTIINVPENGATRRLFYNVNCDGEGERFAIAQLPDGSTLNCATNSYQEIGVSPTNGTLVIRWTRGGLPQNIYVEWAVALGIAE